MYTGYWQLDRFPFPAGSDPRGYYPSETHQGMLARLRYAVENGRGGALVVGASGAGKTMMLRLLAGQLPERFSPIVHVTFPQLQPGELVAHLAVEIAGTDADPRQTSLVENVRKLEHSLAKLAMEGKQPVVMLDDAHLLEAARTLEALRLLLNIEHAGAPILCLVLAGQPSIVPVLERMPHLEERFGVKCLLRALSLEETMAYIQHRMTAAGCPRAVFTSSAMECIYSHSQGSPRRINRLCELALLVGFAQELREIDRATIEEVAGELAAIAMPAC